MIIVMEATAGAEPLAAVVDRVEEFGLSPHILHGVERKVIAVIGTISPAVREAFELMPGVQEVLHVGKPYKFASREWQRADSVIRVRDTRIGGNTITVMAGPCSVESESQLMTTAFAVKEAGATVLRGGAFKPRTSPYNFRGLGEDGLKLLAQARDATGLPIVTEVMSVRDVELVARYTDIMQIGARNSQNFILLDEVGQAGKPVLLKRGVAGTVEELLLSAEYILAQGNPNVILCERGIRTFETSTRNTLDLAAVPVIQRLSHLPVVADPSHGTGKWYLVEPLALAAVAGGAQGLIIEVHPDPDHAKSDGPQSLTPENFANLMPKLARVAEAVGRRIATPVLSGR